MQYEYQVAKMQIQLESESDTETSLCSLSVAGSGWPSFDTCMETSIQIARVETSAALKPKVAAAVQQQRLRTLDRRRESAEPNDSDGNAVLRYNQVRSTRKLTLVQDLYSHTLSVVRFTAYAYIFIYIYV